MPCSCAISTTAAIDGSPLAANAAARANALRADLDRLRGNTSAGQAS